MNFTVSLRKKLPDISSASGLEIVDGKIYIIGDDSPYLFQLNNILEVEQKWEIASIEHLLDLRIPKKKKNDLEGFTAVFIDGETELWIFGSGSKSPARDILIRFSLKNPEKTQSFSLEKIYKNIRETAGLTVKEFNIEAAVADTENLYLFNRGRNMTYQFSIKDFISALTDETHLPNLQILKFDLPEINGIQAGFSGATVSQAFDKIIFTASVENTSNWIDDGEVHGSFIGIIDLKQPKKQPDFLPICEGGELLKIKVESVAIKEVRSAIELHLLLVTDSDDGFSEFIEGVLHITSWM